MQCQGNCFWCCGERKCWGKDHFLQASRQEQSQLLPSQIFGPRKRVLGAIGGICGVPLKDVCLLLKLPVPVNWRTAGRHNFGPTLGERNLVVRWRRAGAVPTGHGKLTETGIASGAC